MIATRVQSNIGGVKGEVITYNCQYESLKLSAERWYTLRFRFDSAKW
jgi:hypothetical protein